MEFLNEDMAEQRQPTEAELQAFLDSHPQRFRIAARLSLQQIYMNPEKRGRDAPEQAAALLVRLNAHPASAARNASLGDATMLPSELDNATFTEIARIFGESFSAEIEKLPVGRWMGPISSSYGLHLVHVSAREPSRLPLLSEVRAAVAREWSDSRRAEARRAFHAALRERYAVSIELPGELHSGQGRTGEP